MFFPRWLRVKLDVLVKMALILVLIQVFFGKEVKGVFYTAISIEKEGHVGRMVIVLIHLLQFLVLKIDYVIGSSSGVIDVRSSLEECLIDLLDQLPIRVLIRSLHFVQNYPF